MTKSLLEPHLRAISDTPLGGARGSGADNRTSVLEREVGVAVTVHDEEGKRRDQPGCLGR